MQIRVGHSPDPDDAFMFYALAKDQIPTDGFRFEHELNDIETLNRWAVEGRLDWREWDAQDGTKRQAVEGPVDQAAGGALRQAA